MLKHDIRTPYIYASRLFRLAEVSYKIVVNLKQIFLYKQNCHEGQSVTLRNIVIVHPHCILRNYASPSHLTLCLMRGLGVPFISYTGVQK